MGASYEWIDERATDFRVQGFARGESRGQGRAN
jgi:hypothetical protein